MTAPCPTHEDMVRAQGDPAARAEVDRAWAAYFDIAPADRGPFLSALRAYDSRAAAERARGVELDEVAAFEELQAAQRERASRTRFALAGRYPEPQQGREAA